MDLCNERQIKALLARHGFRFSKSMGQNFLIVPEIPREIAEASQADESCAVLEIGPGIGPLTVELARRAGRVVSVELDQALLPILAETLAPFDNVEVIHADVMKLDLTQLVQQHMAGLTPLVCANLPYNITTPVLTRLLECGLFRSITVLIQKEVAQRICAAPGSGDYGAFSLLCQYYADCSLLFQVDRDCFLPAPKVTSAVVRLELREKPAVEVSDPALLFRVISASFAQRRKKLLNGLSNAFAGQMEKHTLSQVLDACGFDGNVRGEQLSLADFARLSEAIGGCLN